MATYYVDSRTGSDANNGASAGSAFSSLAKVNSLNLQPGDTVLFARGATFKGTIDVDSGTSSAPIKYGAYGSGADPIVTGGSIGINIGNRHDVVVQDIQLKNIQGTGITANGAANIVIDNVMMDTIGVATGTSSRAAQFWHSKNITVSNSTTVNVTGDALWFWNVDGVKILNNDLRVPHGWYADNVHTYQMRNYEIRGNTMSFVGTTDSGKGIMIVQGSENGVIAENTFILGGTAGHYMIGGTIQNGLIEKNHFIGRAEGTWSTALNISEDAFAKPSTVSNMTVRDNFFDGTGMGIYTWDGNKAGTAYRNNFQVTGNIFKDLRDGPLISESPVKLNGSFANNTFINTVDPKIGSTAGAWSVSNNVHTSTMPTWNGGAGSYKPVEQGIVGTEGNDAIVGTDGADTISGKGGNDILRGGKGNDNLSGGAGTDTYVGERGGGMDRINWFEAGDKIDVKSFGWKSLAEMQAAGVTMTAGKESDGSASVTLNLGSGDGFKVVGVGSLAAANFVFAPAGGTPTTPPPAPPSTPTEGTGTEGADTLIGTDGVDTISGVGGNDVLRGGKGDDKLSGGTGTDIYVGERGGGMDRINWFEAGEKIDVSRFGWKSFAEMQAAGVTMSSGVDASNLYIAFVTVNFGSGDGFKVYGVSSLAATDFAFASASTAPAPSDDLIGTAGDDVLQGTAAAQTLDGKAGNDVLRGEAGNDTLDGGLGDDLLVGGAGNDTLFGGGGSDTAVYAGLFADYAVTTSGTTSTVKDLKALVSGDDGTDTLTGIAKLQFADRVVTLDGGSTTEPPVTPPPSSATPVNGTAGNDKLDGRDDGDDVMNGLGGHDTLRGLSGNDTLRGDGGNDLLYGGAGDDRLEGGTGGDKLLGDAGNDLLVGGAGNDWMDGGAGADTFVFAQGCHADIVSGFQAGTDKLDLSAFGFGDMAGLLASAGVNSAAASQTLWVDFGGGDRLTVFGIGKLTADHVIF